MPYKLKKFILPMFIFILTSLYCNAQEVVEKMPDFDFGIGMGPTYGMLGINLGYNYKRITFFAGVGNEIFSYSNRWSCGLRYYLISNKYSVRPRITLHYGINSEMEYIKIAPNGEVLGNYKELDEGFTIGAGLESLSLLSNTFGLDMEVYYALQNNNTPLPYSENFILVKYGVNYQLTFSLGIRYVFDL